jgi:predicted peroxiredoxin
LKVHESAYGCYKRCTCTVPYKVAYKVLSNEDYDISILATVQVASIKEMHEIEVHYISTMDCVNIFAKDWAKKRKRYQK